MGGRRADVGSCGRLRARALGLEWIMDSILGYVPPACLFKDSAAWGYIITHVTYMSGIPEP